MKISTEIASASRIIGEEKAIEYYAKAGFDAWDFSLYEMCQFDWNNNCVFESTHPLSGKDYLKFARRLNQVAKDNGIICNQTHAPFPSSHPDVQPYIKRSIECSAEVGAEVCVIHPDAFKSPEENAEMYLELLPFAKECNVKIATENMFCWDGEKGHATFAACATPESFKAHIDVVNDPFLVACVDIGHAEMKGIDTSAAELILELGDRVKALHIHDNNKLYDAHQIPFSMDINFEEVVSALQKINYQGYFTLEASSYLEAFDKDNVFEGMKNLEKSVRKLADMFENK